jgi:hypothetical protein
LSMSLKTQVIFEFIESARPAIVWCGRGEQGGGCMYAVDRAVSVTWKKRGTGWLCKKSIDLDVISRMNFLMLKNLKKKSCWSNFQGFSLKVGWSNCQDPRPSPAQL